MHTDDAGWALGAYDSKNTLTADWATSQGRLWAFVAGPQFLFALKFQNTWVGEALRYGSFLLFCTLFYVVAWQYFSRRVALLAATLFVAFHALRFEGSVFITYPLYTWTAGSAFMIAALLARAYVRTGRLAPLVLIGPAYGFSLLTQEGVMALFLLLFPILIMFKAGLGGGIRGFLRRILEPRRVHVLALWMGTSTTYCVAWIWWAATHPNNYAGIAPFDLSRIAAVWGSYVSAGSILGDFVSPYAVNYTDALSGTGASVIYSPWQNVLDLLSSPNALLSGLACTSLIGILLVRRTIGRDVPVNAVASRYAVKPGITAGGVLTHGAASISHKYNAPVDTSVSEFAGDGDPPASSTSEAAFISAGAVAVGLVIAFLPLLPVALTAKYQGWFFDLGVHAHSHSIFAQFGVTLAIAGLVVLAGQILSPLFGQRAPIKTAFKVSLALLVGLIAAIGAYTNDLIVKDMRPEGARWRVVEEALAMSGVSGLPVDVIWAPRFSSGSWFTVVSPHYWSQYIAARYGSVIRVSTRNVLEPDEIATGKAVYLDYIPLPSPSRGMIVTMAHLTPGGKGGEANAITVSVGNMPAPMRSQAFLTYRDMKGRLHAERLATLSVIGDPSASRYKLANVSADAGSVSVTTTPGLPASLPSCGTSLPLPSRVSFGAKGDAAGQSDCLFSLPPSNGWHTLEAAGVWSTGEASLDIQGDASWADGPVYLNILMSSYTGLGFTEGAQTVTVSVNGARLASRSFPRGSGEQAVQIELPKSARVAGSVTKLTFNVDAPIVPNAIDPKQADTRALGIHIRSLDVSRRPASAPASPEGAQRAAGASAQCRADIAGGTTIKFGLTLTPADNARFCLASQSQLTEGWYPQEAQGVWTKGSRSVLLIAGSDPATRPVKITLRMNTYTGMGFYKGAQTVTFSAGATKLGSKTFETGQPDTPVVLDIPASVRTAGAPLAITMDIDRLYSPEKLKIAPDPRDLGAFLREAEIE
ncbi:MAG: hypothetical protein EON93_05120 [Burkholderiales bacterium]|nr:MAG: hypothetical protein EON93_05120 [Burkholderiales bacterium]